MTVLIAAERLKSALHDGGEIALLDIREAGEYGEAHLFFAVNLPYSRLEIEIERLVPRHSTRLVVCGDGYALPAKAAQRLEDLGYTQVSVLDGGVTAWKAAGYALFAGVNVPSKAFGELAEHAYSTPRVRAAELAGWQASGVSLVVLDGRPLAEFSKMSIPGAICCPNGELPYRWRELVTDEATTIVVNCAGRTRSIIGAQTLINLGVRNPVYALENGTQGWMLANLPLDHGSRRRYPERVQARSLVAAKRAAKALAQRHGVASIDVAALRSWFAEPQRTTFLLDVRTGEEFEESSLDGAQHAPGGQLLQATDQYVAVRGARLVVFDDDGVRAPVIASWLRQIGWDAVVLAAGLRSGWPLRSTETLSARASSKLPLISPAQLAEKRRAQLVEVVDLRSSSAYSQAHIPRAVWSIRPRFAEALSTETRPLVLVAETPAIAELAASELPGHERYVLEGGLPAWQAAGFPVQTTPEQPAASERIDFLFFTHDRHDGNKAAARQYLAWELGLLDQLDARERNTFRPGVHDFAPQHTDKPLCLPR